MNWLDIVIIVLVVGPTLAGLKNGIVKAAFTVVGIIVGVILAGRFSGPLGEVMTFIPGGWANVVAFAIILIAVMVIASVLAKIVKWTLSAILLGWVNRLGGAILGFILGVVFCAAILTMYVNFIDAGDAIRDSFLAKFLLDIFPFILGLLPSEFDSVRDFFD